MNVPENKRDSQPLRKLSPRERFIARLLWGVALAVALTNSFLSVPLTLAIQTSVAIDLFSAPLASLGWQPITYVLWFVVTKHLYIAFALVVAFVLAYRRPDDFLSLLAGLVLVLFGTTNLGLNVQFIAGSPLLVAIMASVYAMVAFGANWFILVFPDGRFFPRWTALILVPLIPLAVLDTILRIRSGDLDIVADPITSILALLTMLSIGTQVFRYRVYLTPAQKQQVKWAVAGMGSVALSLLVLFLFDPLITPTLVQRPILRMFYRMLLPVLFVYIPLVFAALTLINAVLRRNLWQVDFAINRSLGYLTVGIIIAVGLGVLLATQSSFHSNPWVLLVPCAVGALLFNPLRRFAQRQIDQRFYHLRYPIEAYAVPAARPEVIKPGKLTGQSVERWELLDVIGSGATSEVYKAYNGAALAAVKLLPRTADAESGIRFTREAAILEKLDHPNIIRLVQHGELEDARFLVMQYVEGDTLRQRLESAGRMGFREAYLIARDVASALDYIHRRGVIHRDLKPSNILLVASDAPDARARAVLMDFGIAKIDATQITGTGTMGTIDYMAPEQIQSSGAVRPASDVYALGVIVFEMITGVRPFRGNPGQVLFAHLTQPPPDPRLYDPNVSPQVVAALFRAMSKQPEDRFASAGEFVAALNIDNIRTTADLHLY